MPPPVLLDVIDIIKDIINQPVSKLLILAGLVFVITGVLGKVWLRSSSEHGGNSTWNPYPLGKAQRWATIAIGLALIAIGIYLYRQETLSTYSIHRGDEIETAQKLEVYDVNESGTLRSRGYVGAGSHLFITSDVGKDVDGLRYWFVRSQPCWIPTKEKRTNFSHVEFNSTLDKAAPKPDKSQAENAAFFQTIKR